MAQAKITGVEEILENGNIVRIRIFGEWAHASGTQPIRQYVDDIEAYVNGTARQKREFVNRVVNALVKERSAELDTRTRPTTRIIEDERTIEVADES